MQLRSTYDSSIEFHLLFKKSTAMLLPSGLVARLLNIKSISFFRIKESEEIISSNKLRQIFRGDNCYCYCTTILTHKSMLAVW